jgi:apolipoprotein D and lipocalin family protein
MLNNLNPASLSALLASALFLGACSSNPADTIPTVKQVDLQRFMGDWYVIANIPTFIEKGAHNALESYALNPDDSIATTFTFNDGGFGGKLKQYRPTGFVQDNSGNADWNMQFIWPFKAEYKIVYLSPDYSQTIIGRTKRDYIWIMARTPQISAPEYQQLLQKAAELGYDTSLMQERSASPQENNG